MEKEKLNIGKDAVTVNTNVKKVVAKKKEETPKVSEDAKSLSKSIESHMADNIENTNVKFDYKSMFTYILLILIVGGCILLIINFFDKYNDGELKKTTAPTTTRALHTTSSTTKTVNYQTTTAAPTQATHTVFDKNRR